MNYELTYDIENADTTCPSLTCGKNRFYLKFYCGKTILYCQDCGYFTEI